MMSVNGSWFKGGMVEDLDTRQLGRVLKVQVAVHSSQNLLSKWRNG